MNRARTGTGDRALARGNGHQTERHEQGHPDPRQIREAIEHTRVEIDHTIDELKNAASPEQIARTVVAALRGGPGQFLANFGRTVRDNPVPTALTTLGLVWLASSSTSDAGERTPRVSAIEPKTQGTVERLASTGREVADTARDRAGQLQGKARHLEHEARDQFWTQMQGNPLVLGAIGVAVGAAIGASLPSTRTEDRRLGHLGDKARQQVARVGEQAQQVAHDVTDRAGQPGQARVGEAAAGETEPMAEPYAPTGSPGRPYGR